MKGAALKLAALMLLGSAIITACSTSKPVVVTPTGQVLVTEQPPPAKQEFAGTPPPGESYVWAQGYWMHTDNRWVWVPGHWQARPTATATWVPGHWDKAVNGWVWTAGHWE